MLRTRLFLNLLPFVVILLATGVYAIVLFSRLAASADTAVLEHYRSVAPAQRTKALLATQQDVQTVTRRVTHLMLLGMAVALVISTYACYQLSRSVLRPIKLVTDATRELGEGNLKHPVPVLSNDELGELALAFNKLAAQLEQYRHSTTEQIVRLHRTMETTLASFPDPIFVLNKAGCIELMNPAAAQMAACLQMAGQLPLRLRAIAHGTLSSGKNFMPHTFDAVLSYRLNSAERSFLPRILTMRDEHDALFGVAVVLYDVTRFRLLDAAKTHLVGTVSHELKTPLTSVRMVLHILLEKTIGPLNPRQQELLETARGDTERLLRILNDLLDLARLEEGAADLHREKAAPAELLQAAMEEAADKAAAKQLNLRCVLDPALPPVLVDRPRIGHVFTNLLTNAINHSPAGGEVRLRAIRDNDGLVLFTISDDGPGIPPEYHQRIFDRFFRVPGQTRSGAGLGLSIAREIAIAHGGRISVKSGPGQGATFCLELKAAPQASSSATLGDAPPQALAA
jgi:signal transduction histidine kinase